MDGFTYNKDSVLGLGFSIDQEPIEGSNNLITSGAVYTALEDFGVDVFVGTYGVTTYDEIEEAYQSGKMIFINLVDDGHTMYTLSSWDLDGSLPIFRFSTTREYYNYEVWVDSEDQWDGTRTDFVTTSRKINNKPLSTNITLTASDVGAQEELPDQSGNAGKFLTTDGSDISWETITDPGNETLLGSIVASGYSCLPSNQQGRYIVDIVYSDDKKMFFALEGPEITDDSIVATTGKILRSSYPDDGLRWISTTMMVSSSNVSGIWNRLISSYLYNSSTGTYEPCLYAVAHSIVYCCENPSISPNYLSIWKQSTNQSFDMNVGCSGRNIQSVAGNTDCRAVLFSNLGDSKYIYRVSGPAGDTNGWVLANNLPVQAYWGDACYDEYTGCFIVVPYGGSQSMYTDTDGITFKARNMPKSAKWSSVAYGDKKVIAVAENSTTGAISADHGYSWTELTLPVVDGASWTSITYGQGKWIIVGKNSNIGLVSVNGRAWFKVEIGTNTEITQNIMYGDTQSFAGRFITYNTVESEDIGMPDNKGSIYYSSDRVALMDTVRKLIEDATS